MNNEKELLNVVNDASEETDIIELLDEDGKPVRFYVVANLSVDDDDYAILCNEEDDEEVLVFKVTEQDDEFIFEGIENEKEFETVIEAYHELLEEYENESTDLS